jgi:TPR repeat protein
VQPGARLRSTTLQLLDSPTSSQAAYCCACSLTACDLLGSDELQAHEPVRVSRKLVTEKKLPVTKSCARNSHTIYNSSGQPCFTIMAFRPDFIDVSSRTTSASGSYRIMGLPSPRIQHFDGDVPPALSPLDAIAAHSRRLAKELEETRIAGERRMSRLPPHVVTASLNEHQANRPQIFRSLSDQVEHGVRTPEREDSGTSPEYSQPKTRPTSSYPRISRVLEATQDEEDDNFHTPRESTKTEHRQPDASHDYFGSARSVSPERLPIPVSTIRTVHPEDHVVTRHLSTTSQPDLTFTLVSPGTALTRRTNQLKLRHEISSDDDFGSSNAGSTFSQHRKLSSNSGMSMPLSPVSPHAGPQPRSPSLYSNASEHEQRRSRSNLNFSRPISSTSLNQIKGDAPSKQQAGNSQSPLAAHSQSFDLPRTPTSFEEARTKTELPEGQFAGPSASYTYGKFSLPRGRKVLRDSAIFSGLSTPHFEWAEPMFPSTPPLGPMSEKGLDTPSPPPTRATKSFDTSVRPGKVGFSFDLDAERGITRDEASKAPFAGKRSVNNSTGSAKSSAGRPSTESIALGAPLVPPMPLSSMDINSISSRSESTIRPQTARTNSDYQGLSPDDHVTKGIELHQYGDLKESTYHLRIAAKQGHPTGMLLYALACRHGWGMRSNQKEGVQWLRKAVDCAMLEVADDEDTSNDTPARDATEKKAHRAQFALSIYELGVSHMNGWGIEQDKALALRCFEIAGNWGDVDALSEAGFCYTQGIGCKKDLHRAAKLYRTAGAKGASMVGNSWIYKEKYDEKDEPERKSRSKGPASKLEKKTRDKSKTRSIFTRKKSFQP